MSRARAAAACSVALACGALACGAPALPDRASLVTHTRVLAVVSEPAEAAPDARVTLTALIVDASGTRADAAPSWAFCLEPLPPTESGSVNSACADSAEAGLGTGVTVGATLPLDACQRFGPFAAEDTRPRDADPTGGYYQPVRVAEDDVIAFAFPRLACGVANATVEDAAAFADRYRMNRNPAVVVDAPESAAPRADVALRASWPADAAERFVRYDPVGERLVDAREAMSVAWFATAGSFTNERTGRAGDDDATESENAWRAPGDAGLVHLWVVLRDDRGGTAFTEFTIDVRE